MGLASLAAFGVATVWLAAAAVARGSAHTPPLGPDVAALGGDALSRVTGALAVVPILLTASECLSPGGRNKPGVMRGVGWEGRGGSWKREVVTVG